MTPVEFCQRLFEEADSHRVVYSAVALLAHPELPDRFPTIESARDYLACDRERADAVCTALQSLQFVDIALGGLLTWNLPKPVQIVSNGHCGASWDIELADGFERFWRSYKPGTPRGAIRPNAKGSKPAARKAFLKAIRTPAMIQDAVNAAAKQSLDGWSHVGGASPHAATWINQGRWEDSAEEEVAAEVLTDPREMYRRELLDKVARGVLTDCEAATRFRGPLS